MPKAIKTTVPKIKKQTSKKQSKKNVDDDLKKALSQALRQGSFTAAKMMNNLKK